MSDVLRAGDAELALRGLDILLADVHHDPGRLRAFLTRQLKAGEEGALFGQLMQVCFCACAWGGVGWGRVGCKGGRGQGQ